MTYTMTTWMTDEADSSGRAVGCFLGSVANINNTRLFDFSDMSNEILLI